MVPRPLPGQSLAASLANTTGWMLLPRDAVSFDGAECDKVGTSFAAFRYQGGACRRSPGTCLTNQLKDLHVADQQRVRAGRAPLYLVSQYADGTASELRRWGGAVGPLSFSLPVRASGAGSSVVLLEAAADALRFVTAVSPGNITGACLCVCVVVVQMQQHHSTRNTHTCPLP